MGSSSILSKVIFYLLFIPINSLIFYVITDNEAFLQLAIFSLVATVLIYLKFKGKRVEAKYKFKKVYRTRKRDILNLVSRYLRINRKFILGSGVGLFLATGIITQSVVVSTSYQQYAFNEYLENSDVSAYSYSFKWISKDSAIDWEERVFPKLTQTVEANGISIRDTLSYGMVEYQMIIAEIRDVNTRYLNVHSVKTREWSKEFYDLLSGLPTFPDIEYNSNDSILVVPDKLYYPAPEFGTVERSPSDAITKVGNKSTYQVLLERAFKLGDEISNTSIPFNNLTLSVDYVWEVKVEDLVFIRSNGLNIPSELLAGTQFIPKDKEWEIYDELESKQTKYLEFPHVWGKLWMEGYIWVNIPLLTEMEIRKFQILLSDTVEQLYASTVNFVNSAKSFDINHITGIAYSPLDILILDYLKYEENLSRIMVQFSAPLLIISLFFYFFAISITQKRKIEIFYKMKIRGSSTQIFLIIMLAEILAYTVVAAVIGFVTGLFSSGVIMNIIEGVQGQGTTIPTVFPDYIYWKLPVIGGLFAILFNLNGMFEASMISYESLGNLNRENKSVLSSSNFDLYTFSFAVSYWVFVPILQIPGDFTQLVYEQLGYAAIIATIFSLPLMSQRFYFPLLRRVSKKLPDGILYLSFTNIVHHRKYTTKFFALLLITLFFAFQGMISTSTVVNMNAELTDYSIGSDLYVQGLNTFDPDRFRKIRVDGVEEASAITELAYKANIIEKLPGQELDDTITYRFLGVNKTSLSQTMNWKDNYADQSLNNTIKKLEPDSMNIALHKEALQVLGLQLGDNLTVRYGYRSQNSVSLKITSTFNYFPRLVFKDLTTVQHKSDLKDIYIVTDLEDMETLSDFFSRGLKYGALVRLQEGADMDIVTKEIYKQYVDETYVVLSAKNFQGSVFAKPGEGLSPLVKYEEYFIYASLSTMLFIGVLVGILGTMYYSYIIIKTRKKDLGVFKALGMIKFQMMKLLLVEILTLILSAIAFSFVTAYYLTRPIFNILTGTIVNTTPPFEVSIPWGQIGIFTFVQAILAFILAITPANYVSKQSTAQIVEAI